MTEKNTPIVRARQFCDCPGLRRGGVVMMRPVRTVPFLYRNDALKPAFQEHFIFGVLFAFSRPYIYQGMAGRLSSA